MLNLLSGFAVAVAFYVVYAWIKSSIEDKRFQKFAEENGCVAPFRVPNQWPGGLERVWGVIRLPWTGKDLFDDFLYPGQVAANYTSELSGLFGFKQLMTTNPENFKAMLATKFNDFDIGSARRNAFGVLLGKSIFNTDGPIWSHARAMFRPQFNKDNINNLEDTERSTELLFSSIPVKSDGWTDSFNIQPLFFNFTLDTATAFLFGESIDTLQRKVPGHDHQLSEPELRAQEVTGTKMTLAEAIDEAQWWLVLRIRLSGARLAPPRFLSGKLNKAVTFIHTFVDHYSQAAIGSGKSDLEKEIGSKKYDLLHALTESTQDKEELRDQILGKS